MNKNNIILDNLTARVKQLIFQYKKQKKENEKIHELLNDKEKRIFLLEQQLNQKSRDIEGLKTAKMIEFSNGDIEKANDRINHLIREINKCITLLNNNT